METEIGKSWRVDRRKIDELHDYKERKEMQFKSHRSWLENREKSKWVNKSIPGGMAQAKIHSNRPKMNNRKLAEMGIEWELFRRKDFQGRSYWIRFHFDKRFLIRNDEIFSHIFFRQEENNFSLYFFLRFLLVFHKIFFLTEVSYSVLRPP